MPTRRIFATPLTRLTKPSRPKSRLKPAIGDSFEKSGFSFEAEKNGRCCSKCPPKAARIITPIAGPRMAKSPKTDLYIRNFAPPLSSDICAGLSRKTVKRAVNSRAALWAKSASASAPPAVMTKVASSWLLTTSPFLSASSRRLCVGSSVRWESSRSSATGDYPPKRRIWAAKKSRKVLIMTPMNSIRRTKPARMLIGMARKKICNCGISRESTPSIA